MLVTIREEDWRRASLSGAVVAFDDVSLTLGESEAEEIYVGTPGSDHGILLKYIEKMSIRRLYLICNANTLIAVEDGQLTTDQF